MTANAQKTLINHTHKNLRTTSIKVESIFEHAFSHGYMPVRVTIRNGTKEDRNWNIAFNYGGGYYNSFGYSSSFTRSARANSEAVHEILVPVPTAIENSNYRNLVISISSRGLSSASTNDSNQVHTQWPGIAISKKLALRSLSQLNDQANRSGHGTDVFGGKYEPEMLPSTDWRAYSGLDLLLIDAEEWNAVPAGPRKAIREWVRQGGRLDIYAKEQGTSPVDYGFPDADLIKNGVHQFSLGEVSVQSWDGRELQASSVVNRYKNYRNGSENYAEDYDNDWGLQRSFGVRSFNPSLVFILLIAFAIIVGPVNLFVFAKPGQRQKLFITTPIISLIASLLIFALIMLKDGIGGSGQRLTFANIQPGSDERNIYLVQEQLSRTGVLLGAGFEVDDAAFVTPVRLRPSEWNRLTDTGNQARGAFSKNGNVYAGSWFQSRSEQGQAIRSVLPTRSRIELRAPANGTEPPKLFSSLEFEVGEFFYRGQDGKVWKSTSKQIPPGKEIPLQVAELTEFNSWWDEQTKDFSSNNRKAIRAQRERTGHFFAVTEDQRAARVETLSSIRWKGDRVVASGAVLPEGSAAAPVAEPTPETGSE